MKRRTFLALTLTAVGLKLGPRPSKWAQPVNPALPPIPSGFIMPCNVPRIPRGWLVCDGRVLRQRDYPGLAQALGKAYGSAKAYESDGVDTFRLPNLRERARGLRPAAVSPRVWQSWDLTWVIKA